MECRVDNRSIVAFTFRDTESPEYRFAMEHYPATSRRHVRFHLQDKENSVHPLPPKSCGRINTPKTTHSTPETQKPPSFATSKRFQQPCTATSNLAEGVNDIPNNNFNNSNTRAMSLQSNNKESSSSNAAAPERVRRDQDPVASTLLQDDTFDTDKDVVVMCGDLKDWPGLLRPVATKLHRSL